MEGRTDSPGPNESFDALIELLGSDDVVQDRRFNNRFDDGLRDADGKLNFGKMHSFFSGRQDDGDHQAPVSYGDTFARPSEPGISNEHPDHNICGIDDSPLPQSSSQMGPVNSDTGNISRSNTSISDEDSTDISHHDAPALSGPISPQYIAADRKRNNHILDINTQRHADHEPLQISPFAALDSEPIEVEALTQALRLANAEVVNLRRQCDDLWSLTHGHRSSGDRSLRSPVLRPVYDHPNSSASAQAELQLESTSTTIHMPPEIAKLTGDEARQTLASILHSLSPPLSGLSGEITHEAKLTAGQQPVNIAGIRHALNFVLRTDELIWRRSVYGSVRGGPTTTVFDEQNLTALSERLSLWERVVRGSRL